MCRAVLLLVSFNFLLLGPGVAQSSVEASFGFDRAVHVLPLPPSPIRGQRSEPTHHVYGEVRLRTPLSGKLTLLSQLQLAAEGTAATALRHKEVSYEADFFWPRVRTVELKLGPAVEFALTEVIGVVGGAYGSYRISERVDPATESPFGSSKRTDLRATLGFRAHVRRWSAELMYEQGVRDSEGDIAVNSLTDAPIYPRYYRTSLRLGVGYVIAQRKNKP